MSAINFRPEEGLVDQADERLAQVEGHGLGRLAAQIYEERSRRGVGDFALTYRIDGYWDRNDTEINLVAINEDDRIIRFGTIKRSPERLLGSLDAMNGHIERFLTAHHRYRGWRHERVAIAPKIDHAVRVSLGARGAIPQDLTDLVQGL